MGFGATSSAVVGQRQGKGMSGRTTAHAQSLIEVVQSNSPSLWCQLPGKVRIVVSCNVMDGCAVVALSSTRHNITCLVFCSVCMISAFICHFDDGWAQLAVSLLFCGMNISCLFRSPATIYSVVLQLLSTGRKPSTWAGLVESDWSCHTRVAWISCEAKQWNYDNLFLHQRAYFPCCHLAIRHCPARIRIRVLSAGQVLEGRIDLNFEL